MLISVFRSLGEMEKARSYARLSVKNAEEELRLHPENANCACLGATALAFLGEHERAMEWLARSLATDPSDTNIQYNAACTYALLGEAERAIDLLETWVLQVGNEMRLMVQEQLRFRYYSRSPAIPKIDRNNRLNLPSPENSLASHARLVY